MSQQCSLKLLDSRCDWYLEHTLTSVNGHSFQCDALNLLRNSPLGINMISTSSAMMEECSLTSKDTDSVITSTAIETINVQQLFITHRVHLLRFVKRYLRNDADAEDVVQLTFIEAMRCAERYSGLSKASTWLFGIGLNLARSHVRKKRGDFLDMAEDSELENFIDEYADPARIVEARQIVNCVGGVMNQLPVQIRVTFETVLEGDVSYEQAAEKMGIPVGTVRSRVSRVRALLRTQMGDK